MPLPTLPFDGLNVVDMTEGAQGPFAVSLLADLGASVVKVERPGGEMMRQRFTQPTKRGKPLALLSIARGRVASVVLDLRTDVDRRALLELVRSAHMFIENWKPGVAEQFGLSHADLVTINSQLLYVSASGYGTTGPWARRGAFGSTADATGGLASVSGPAGGPSERPRVALLDFISAMVTAEAAIAAIALNGHRSGAIHAETSQLESAIAAVSPVLSWVSLGKDPFDGGPSGTYDRLVVPSSLYPCRRGRFVAIHAETVRQWQSLTEVLALTTEVEWATAEGRRADRIRLDERIARATSCWEAAGLVKELSGHRVPASVVRRSMSEVMSDPKLSDNHVAWRLADEGVGWVAMAQAPWRFSACEVRAGQACPPLGGSVRPDWRALWGDLQGTLTPVECDVADSSA